MWEEYLSIVLRSVIVYLFMVIAIRLFGKKEIAQLSVIDLVFILLISNSVQNAMVGPSTSLEGGLIAAFSLFAVNFILKQILYRSKKASELVQGHSIMLIYDGKVIQENLSSAKISMDELEASVREHGVKNISDVDLAVLEVDGNISVLSHDFKHKTVRKRKAHKVIAKET
jgi:uncharacterized membrane protein YcaP (DUF421 family)